MHEIAFRLCVLVLCVGCAGEAEPYLSEAESEGVVMESTEEIDPSCGSVMPSKTYTIVLCELLRDGTGGFSGVSECASVSPHSTKGCFRGYVVALAHPSPWHTQQIAWDGPTPTTQTACQKAWLRVHVFVEMTTGWSQLEAKDIYGKWVDGACVTPVYRTIIASHKTFKFAATARPAYQSSTLYPIKFGWE